MIRKKLTSSEQKEILIFNLISALFLISCTAVFSTTVSISDLFGDAKYTLPMFVGVLYMAFVTYDFQCSINSYYFFYDSKVVLHNKMSEVDFLYSEISSYSEKDGILYLNLKSGKVHKIYSEDLEFAERELSNKLEKVQHELEFEQRSA